MLVGSDVFAEHGERGITIAGLQVAQDLIIGAVFLDDVDDMLNRILPGVEHNLPRIALHQIALLRLESEAGKLRLNLAHADPSDRPVQESGDVSAIASPVRVAGVGTGAFAFAAGNQQIVATNRQSGG